MKENEIPFTFEISENTVPEELVKYFCISVFNVLTIAVFLITLQYVMSWLIIIAIPIIGIINIFINLGVLIYSLMYIRKCNKVFIKIALVYSIVVFALYFLFLLKLNRFI